ncbi:hypothetical protein R70723_30320 [Paenibacillus sp. FSL R7-0273]|uniref:glycosyltransferase n=1 Tax=Paenibacillus sp. FSL R7-0273 TaxID=1536772 RepID=UPI0004F6FB93|nr:glycosyltransferase [Paenibacillus sp. FSL R7-0273]AIQ49699.1 hypothetical protein R70723_30320 [Paenibacillus sp. FSL R7-0273]OMF90243.1 hypothetical protein BK144_17740 [Paenibacillus sp. FSL R7-0273]
MINIPKRVLFVNGLPIDKGGIETAIMQVYRGIERRQLLIDFAVRKPETGHFHEEIERYGGRIFNLFANRKHNGNKKWNFAMDIYYIYSFYKLLKDKGPFCAVHIAHPMLEGFLMIAAKMAGVPVRIAHSNNTGIDDKQRLSLVRKLTRKLKLTICREYATHIWGCSKEASKYQFGKNILEDKRSEIVPYPVAIHNFVRNPCNRNEACLQLNIEAQNINLINVGRYTPQKNQLFLLETFKKMLNKRNDLHLMLTGPGSLENEIREYIEKLDMKNYVTMLESNTSIPLALSASDYFLLPSIYEGFGIVLIEAQAASIPCIVSDVCQPEPDMGLVDYIPLDKGSTYWADYILSKIQQPEDRTVNLTRLMEYDVSNVAPRMQKVYLEGLKYGQ